jgi:2,4-dienoyl-CoA reductase-like NADH-dependent reductase (Old Yellow Enzyme family)
MLLQQAGSIGPLKLRNRVVMAPMGTNYSTTDGLSTERDKHYYSERARGGVAMIMTEAMVVTEQARPHHNSLCVYHDRFIPGLASVVDAIKQHGAYVFGQLNHRGGLLRRSVLNMEPVGPSPWINPNTGDPVRPLSVAEIRQIQLLFVAAARRLQQAGYDGVEIHAGNGYLFQQFLTPRINQRTDCYGGSTDNRSRFLLETVERVRDAMPDLPLLVRLSVSEFAEGGYTQEDILHVAQGLERAGVAALDLSGGSNESPQLSKYCIQPPSFPRGFLAPYAKPIKQTVSIPVLLAGRIVDPADAEAVLLSGSADFVSLGRALYADAHWCLKAFGEVKAPIRKCIACNVCFERLTLERDVSCVQNPMVGTEFEELRYAEPHLFASRRPGFKARRLLVLGAGVTGIEVARIAAGRGHHVEVWEKSDKPGGQIHLATAAPDKQEVEPVWSYRWEEVQELGVPVRTNVVATNAMVRAFSPDLVVVATGAIAHQGPFDLTGLSPQITMLQAWDYLKQPNLIRPDSHVTIIGAGTVGLEAADLLRTQGCTATLIEMLSVPAPNMARNNRFELIERLNKSGTRIRTNTLVTRVIDTTVIVREADKGEKTIDIGSYLMMAVGPKPNREPIAMLDAAGVEYVLAGDCYRPGDFLSCLRDAWMVALSLDTRFGVK